MPGEYAGLDIVLGMDTGKFNADLAAARAAAKGAGREMSQLNKYLKLNPGDMAAVAAQAGVLERQLNKSRMELANLLREEQRMRGVDPTSPEWTRLQGRIAAARTEVERLTQQLRELRFQQSTLGTVARSMQNIGTSMMALNGVGRTLTRGVTMPIMAVGAASVAAATSIDSGLTGVRKTVEGTEQDYQRLKQAAIDFSKTNGVSAKQVLDVEALGAQLGFTLDELQGFSEVVNGLDLSTNLDFETAATEMAQFFNIMGESHDNVSNFGSALIDLGNHFSTTESDIMDMAMRIAGAGQAMGMTSSEVLGLSTALTSVGINAEAGGSAISTLMSQIDKDVATNSESLEVWAATANMSAEQFAAAWNNNAVDAFQALIQGMAQGVEEGGNLAVMLDQLGISSIRQTDTVKRLVGAFDLLPNAVQTANSAWAENTALTNEVANFNGSLAAQFQMVANRALEIADKIGGPLAQALLAALDAAQPLFDALANGAQAFADMSTGEQQAIIQTVALVAAIGPLMSVASNVGTAVNGLGTVIAKVATGGSSLVTSMGSMVTKLFAVQPGALVATAAIAALGLAIADNIKHAEEFSASTDGLKDAVNSLDEPAERAAQTAENAGRAWRSYANVAYDAAADGARLADSIRATNDSAKGDGAQLDIWVQKIDALAGNCGGSAAKLAELRTAVEQYNSITGDSVTITDNVSGALSRSTDAINANAEAWKANAMAQAAQSNLSKLAERQIDLENQLSVARQNLANAQAEDTRGLGRYEAQTFRASAATREAQAAYDSLCQQYVDNQEAMDQAVQQVEGYTEAANREQEAVQQMESANAQAMASFLEGNVALQERGTAFDILAQQLDAFGISVNDMATMSSEALVLLADNSDKTGAEIVAAFDAMGVELPEKVRNAFLGAADAANEASGELVDTSQQIFTGVINVWDENTQSFHVVGANAIGAAAEGIDAGSPMFLAACEAALNGAQVIFDGANWSVNGEQLTADLAAAILACEGDVQAAAEQLGITIPPPLETAATESEQAGTDAGAGFSGGLEDAEGAVQAAVQAYQSAVQQLSSLASQASTWGSHLGSNFASGISSQVGAVQAAASAVASAAAAVLQHTAPKEGPLKGGEWIWGRHAAINFAEGLGSGVELTRDAATDIAEAAAEELSDEYLFRQYMDEMISTLSYRSKDAQAASTKLAGVWSSSAAKLQENMFSEGAVVDSVRRMADAGIDSLEKLADKREDYNDKLKKYAEEEADWAERLADSSLSDSSRARYEKQYAEWTEERRQWMDGELAEWNAFNASLASDADLSKYWNLAQVKIETNDAYQSAKDTTNALWRLWGMSSTVFTEDFVNAFADGSDEYKAVLKDMANMSEREIKNIVDAYDGMARAEREQEIQQRSLWIRSQETMATQGRDTRDMLLDFRETCLDVKQALLDTSGLSGAFAHAGASVEGFAADLASMGIEMDDFTDKFQSFTADVSNGFSQMTKYNQTDLKTWQENLKLNMAESQRYAENTAKVMAMIPESLDSEAFRKTVYEGGFAQWGQIMDDLARANSKDVREAVELYNKAILEGQQSAIEQFRAIAPGEEMANAIADGLAAGSAAVGQTSLQAAQQALDALESTETQFNNVGQALGGAVRQGMASTLSGIAADAAAQVRAAIEAARAAADASAASTSVTNNYSTSTSYNNNFNGNYVGNQGLMLLAKEVGRVQDAQATARGR